MSALLEAEELVEILQASVASATADAFEWSRGIDIFNQGIEAVMEVYAAQALFEKFRSEKHLSVFLQFPTGDLGFVLPTEVRHGRFDLVVRDARSNTLFVVEFKRYMNPASIASDVERLCRTALSAKQNGFKSFGFVAGPMITDSRQFRNSADYKYEERYMGLFRSEYPEITLTGRKGASVPLLPIYSDRTGRDIHFPIVVQFATSAATE